MNCPKCKTELSTETAAMHCEFAAHDSGKIDVMVVCDNCCSYFNGFLNLSEMLFEEGV